MTSASPPAGFTLIELLVVVAIIALLTAVLLTSNSKFNSAILLRSLAYQVGFSLREAQLYGVAVKETSAGSGDFNAAYGIYLPVSVIGVANGSYTLFADLSDATGKPNGLYDAGSDPVVENFSFHNGFRLSNFCTVTGTVMNCAAACPSPYPAGVSSCAGSVLQWIAVSFRRPNPNAIIRSNTDAGAAQALITVAAPGGAARNVSISSTGQIIVEEAIQ